MRTYKLTVVYDGTRYQGWQRQKTTEMTIQEVLETAITQVAGRETKIDGSGRTDGGVHAKGQTASVTLPGKVAENEFRLKLNAVLPEDVRVKEMLLMKNGFHARQNAKGKRYEYFVDTREKPDVFTRKYCYHYPYKLNISAMKEEGLFYRSICNVIFCFQAAYYTLFQSNFSVCYVEISIM